MRESQAEEKALEAGGATGLSAVLRLRTNWAKLRVRWRSRPEELLLLTLGVFLGTNLYAWSAGRPFLVALFQYGIAHEVGGQGFRGTNPVFPVTYSAAFISMVYSLLVLRYRAGVRWIRALPLAVTFPFAFVGSFELVWGNAFAVSDPSAYQFLPVYYSVMISWFVLGLSTAPFWRWSRWTVATWVAVGAVFAMWMVIGYPQLYAGGPFAAWAFPVNVASKVGFAFAFAVLLWEGTTYR